MRTRSIIGPGTRTGTGWYTRRKNWWWQELLPIIVSSGGANLLMILKAAFVEVLGAESTDGRLGLGVKEGTA